jgi:hypothetical protein
MKKEQEEAQKLHAELAKVRRCASAEQCLRQRVEGEMGRLLDRAGARELGQNVTQH